MRHQVTSRNEPRRVYYGRRALRTGAAALLGLFVVLVWTVRAGAQGHAAGDRFVAVRGGTNLVGNTYRVRERKPEPGAGASVGTYLSPGWMVELDAWMRASNPECCGARRREMLYSVGVIRLLTSGGVQPYMVGGLTWMNGLRSELQVQVGVGAQFPLARRIDVAIDLRGNGGGSTMIVRPAAAIIYLFRQ